MFTRRTINRWLREGIPARSWPRVVAALDVTEAVIKRYERTGIPEASLRKLEAQPKQPKPPIVRRYEATSISDDVADYSSLKAYLDAHDAKDINEDDLEELIDHYSTGTFDEDSFDDTVEYEYDISEDYDIDFWEDIGTEYDGDEIDYSDFEKLS